MPSFHEDYLRTYRRDQVLFKAITAAERRRHQAERRRYTPVDCYEPLSRDTRARHNRQLQRRL